MGPQVGSEAREVADRPAALHHKHAGAGPLALCKDVSPLRVQDTVGATDLLLETLVSTTWGGAGVALAISVRAQGLHQPRGGLHGGRVQRLFFDASLLTRGVLTQHPLLGGGPLGASHHAVLNLPEVLHTLGDLGEDVGAGRPKAPDLAALRHAPLLLSAR